MQFPVSRISRHINARRKFSGKCNCSNYNKNQMGQTGIFSFISHQAESVGPIVVRDNQDNFFYKISANQDLANRILKIVVFLTQDAYFIQSIDRRWCILRMNLYINVTLVHNVKYIPLFSFCSAGTSVSGVQLHTKCNSNCGCNLGIALPVCGSDNITYLSPCYAGCSTVANLTVIFM